MQMEVDDQGASSVFLVARTASKRSRSESPSPDISERKPPKRLLTDDLLRVPSPYSANPPLTVSSTTPSRFPSEDWVKQADGLRIDSPMSAFHDLNFGAEHQRDAGPVGDTGMHDGFRTDEEGSHELRPSLARRPSEQEHTKGHFPLPARRPASPEGPAPPVSPPTPAPAPWLRRTPREADADPDAGARQMAEDFDFMMGAVFDEPEVDPGLRAHPYAYAAPKDAGVLQKYKPRIAMGPRAGCEKCRMGVKGHWMHFD